MLTTYLLTGLLGGGGVVTPTLDVPLERVIRVTKTGAFVTAAFSIDPTDALNFELDLTGLLETGENFTTVSLAILPASTTLGFTIPESGPYGVTEIAPGRLQFWPLIEDADQNRTAWASGGTACGFEVLATTDLLRKWQRTVLIRVVQK